MQKLVRDYLNEWKKQQKRRRRTGIAVVLLVVLVVGGVIGGLTQYGVAMTGNVKCGIEEHQHTDSCYSSELVCGQEESAGHHHGEECYQTESTLICGQEESEEHAHGEECYAQEDILVCGQEEYEGHTHTDSCYENQLSCGIEEHIHTEDCYIDTNADVEDASVWDDQYKDAEWKDVWGEDLAAAAGMQVGYKESSDNYTVTEDGSHKGYTRYGQFAGDVYVDWDAAFVNFCLYYAGLDMSNLFPGETDTAKWCEEFIKIDERNQGCLTAPEGYEPKTGDIVFFAKENEEREQQMGIVSSYNSEKGEIKVIEGNVENEVKENDYSISDSCISSYLKITELENAYKNVETETEEQEADPEVQEEQTEEPEADTEVQEEQTEEPEADSEVQEDQTEGLDTSEEMVFAEQLNYEDENVAVTVGAKETGIISEGAALKVVPIVSDSDDTVEQYRDVEKRLREKAEEEEYEIAGFLAYDISFIDQDGNEMEPNGEVKVVMDYKEAVIPEDIENADIKLEDTDVTVMHLEEDEKGDVKEVVDLSKSEENPEGSGKVEILETTENQEIQKAEFVTERFSIYTFTWMNNKLNSASIDEGDKEITIHYVDRSGNDIVNPSTIDLTGDFTLGLINGAYNRTLSNKVFAEAKIGSTEGEAIVSIRKENGQLEYMGTDNYSSKWKVWGKTPYDIYMVYDDQDTEGIPPVESKLGVPEHNKEITKNTEDNYTLSLDVTGEKYESEIDILLIIDKSGSMTDQGKTRYENVNKAIASLKEAIKSTDISEDKVNIAAVTFSQKIKSGTGTGGTGTGGTGTGGTGTGGTGTVPGMDSYFESDGDASIANDWEKINNFGYKLEKEVCEGRTNWQAGVRVGSNLLKQQGTDSQKYVIFLTDGNPTCRYYAPDDDYINASNTHTQGAIAEDTEPYINKNYFAAVAEWNNSPILKSATTYVVDANETSKNSCDEFAAAIGAKEELDGANEASMVESFEHIAENIFNVSYRNVCIQDTLSEYVDFANGQDTAITVTKTTKEGDVELEKGKDYTSEIDIAKKQVKVNLLNGGELEDGVIYKVKFDVVPTDQAYADWYIQGGYQEDISQESENTEIIDSGEDNNTNSELVGFRSNANAIVQYQEGNNPAAIEEYNYPVFEIKPELKKHSVEKIWSLPENKEYPTSVKVELKAFATIKNESGNEEIKEILNTEYRSLPDDMEKTLTEDEAWKDTWENLPVYYYYKNEEDGEWEKTDISYTVEEKMTETLKEQYTSSIDTVENGSKTIITNTPKWQIRKIRKNGDLKVSLEDAKFSLTKADGDDLLMFTGTSDKNGILNWKDKDGKDVSLTELEKGSYKLTEIQAPMGYSKNSDCWIITFESKGAFPKITKSNDGNNEIQYSTDGADGNIYTFEFENEVLYELPETGGSGIYWYMFSGILLMAGASLITYKKRCREVLRS